jgi:hypothetical protein
VASAAKKLKTPAIATGVGLVGLAGGAALARDRHKRVLGVRLPNGRTGRAASKNLAATAKSVGALAERTGHVAEQMRVVGEALSNSESANGGRRRAPIEVVLEGLTRRSRMSSPE